MKADETPVTAAGPGAGRGIHPLARLNGCTRLLRHCGGGIRRVKAGAKEIPFRWIVDPIRRHEVLYQGCSVLLGPDRAGDRRRVTCRRGLFPGVGRVLYAADGLGAGGMASACMFRTSTS